MNALAIEVDQALRSLDPKTAARLERLDQARSSVGIGKTGTSAGEILDDIRSDRVPAVDR